MKVKMFVNDGDIPKLEREISKRLTENRIDVEHSHIQQSYNYDRESKTSMTLISIWYEEII